MFALIVAFKQKQSSNKEQFYIHLDTVSIQKPTNKTTNLQHTIKKLKEQRHTNKQYMKSKNNTQKQHTINTMQQPK